RLVDFASAPGCMNSLRPGPIFPDSNSVSASPFPSPPCLFWAGFLWKCGWIGLAAVTFLAAAQFRWTPMLLQAAGVLLFFLALLYVAGPALKWFWKKSAARVEPADASKMPSTFLAALL